MLATSLFKDMKTNRPPKLSGSMFLRCKSPWIFRSNANDVSPGIKGSTRTQLALHRFRRILEWKLLPENQSAALSIFLLLLLVVLFFRDMKTESEYTWTFALRSHADEISLSLSMVDHCCK